MLNMSQDGINFLYVLLAHSFLITLPSTSIIAVPALQMRKRRQRYVNKTLAPRSQL